MYDKEWLNNLKAGDLVVVTSNNDLYGPSLNKVERVTATQIILVSGGRYRRTNGKFVGADEGWTVTSIVEPTEERRAEIRKKFLVRKLQQVDWNKISVDVLAEIWEKAKNGQHVKDE